MAEASHPTVVPAQTQTDTFAVFRDNPRNPNLTFIQRLQVPRYTRPSSTGVEMGRDKRLQMAVQFAVTSDSSFIESPSDPDVPADLSKIEGEKFYVTDDLDSPMEPVAFERNPAIAGCWNPNEESAAEFVDE